MKLFIIDAYKDETLIHRVLVDEGKYLIPKKLMGTFARQSDDLILLILKERPEKIIFDEIGIGRGLAGIFKDSAGKHGFLLREDGAITY
jgi:hypothetical protein